MVVENDESTWDNEERMMDMQRTIRELEDKITGLTMKLKEVETENEQLKVVND
jgi:regulator of replication initiation timing